MNSYKISAIIILLFFTGPAKAQEFPYHYFTHISPMLNNPALTASESQLSAGVISYNLWAGGFNPLSDKVACFSISPETNKTRNPKIQQPRIGLGAILMNEQIGPFNQYIFQLNYAYHIPLSGNTILSLGMSGILENLNIDINSLSPMADNDPRLFSAKNNASAIDGSFGASFRRNDFRLSFSIVNIAPGSFVFDDYSNEIRNFRKYLLIANHYFKLAGKIGFQPDFTLRNTSDKKINLDVSCNFNLYYASFGLGFRSENSIFIYTRIPLNEFEFTYTSENPLQANHMIGNGHTFSFFWSIK